MEFRDKAVLVTGATSGIGRATAVAFGREGAKVLMTGRSAERGEEVRREVEAAGATVAVFRRADLADAAVCQPLIDEAVARFGRLDVLVNNAGVLHQVGTIDTSDAQWHDTLAVNVTAPFLLSRGAARVMKAQGGGAIVNIGSDLSLRGERGITAYCASKGAILQLTRAMAIDHAADNIRVNIVCPGEIRTPMLEGSAKSRFGSVGQGMAQFAKGVPVGRIGTPEEIAAAVLFLASDRAGFCTGTILSADGGSTAR